MTKDDLRIVFLGTPEFAAYSLNKICDAGYNVVGVVTMPDKVGGRGHKVIHSAVKTTAIERGLHVMQPEKLKSPEFVDELRELKADLFIVIAFRMLPEIVWTMPPLGTFNLHASLLPRYRGAAPINRAVMNGDTETGVTTFFLKHEIDAGDVISQEKIEIRPSDNVGDIHDRLMELGAELTLKTIDDIVAGEIVRTPQERLALDVEPCEAPKIFAEDCLIDWNRPAEELRNQVRGLSPYPGARGHIEGIGDVKIFEVKVSDKKLSPGEVIIDGSNLIVGAGDNRSLEVVSLQAPGKRRMPVADFLRGLR